MVCKSVRSIWLMMSFIFTFSPWLCIYNSVSFIKLVVYGFVVKMFRLVISSWWIFPLMSLTHPFLPLLTSFEGYVSNIKTAIPACFFLLIPFLLFYPKIKICPWSWGVFVGCRIKDGLCLLINLICHSLFIGKMRPLMLRVIIKQCLLILVLLLL